LRAQASFLEQLASEPRYQHGLRSLRLLAQHHIAALVQALLSWRQAQQEDVKAKYSTGGVVNIVGVTKRVRASHAAPAAAARPPGAAVHCCACCWCSSRLSAGGAAG
jgi:hypothetical protein